MERKVNLNFTPDKPSGGGVLKSKEEAADELAQKMTPFYLELAEKEGLAFSQLQGRIALDVLNNAIEKRLEKAESENKK